VKLLIVIAVMIVSYTANAQLAPGDPLPPLRSDFKVKPAEAEELPLDHATLVSRIAPAIRPLPPGITSFKDCDVCPEMVVVPMMPGIDNRPKSEKWVPKRKTAAAISPAIKVRARYAIGRYEITWGQYVVAYREAGCLAPRNLNGPVRVTNKIITPIAYSNFGIGSINCYLAWLSKKTGHRYRLPTSEEWEFAARAGVKTDYPWGNQPGYNNAYLFDENAFDPSIYKSLMKPFDDYYTIELLYTVGEFPPNNWGIYDVIGNVLEPTSKTRTETDPKSIIYCKKLDIVPCSTREIRGPRGPEPKIQEKMYMFMSEKWLDDGIGLRVVREMEN
jgi:formylglycine-generating enzyme required for sulfatase activity